MERGLCEAATSVREEAQHEALCRIGCFGEMTDICIVDENGRICSEAKVFSHPEDLSRALTETGFCIEQIGLEAGPLSQWLFEGMAQAGLPVICVETRHTKAFLRAEINKSDRNDARGIAQMMRVNLYRQVHVKTLASQKRRALLRARKLLQDKAIAIENDTVAWQTERSCQPIGWQIGPSGHQPRSSSCPKDQVLVPTAHREVPTSAFGNHRKSQPSLNPAFSDLTSLGASPSVLWKS